MDVERVAMEARFRAVFAYRGEIAAYARRRGSRDPDGIAAEALTIAWRKLADVPRDDARPWLYATARRLVLAEWRRERSANEVVGAALEATASFEPALEIRALDPQLVAALRSLSATDREALLLVAWEDLSPVLAARALGVNPTAFRVRLLRARRRVQAALACPSSSPCLPRMEIEEP